MTSEDFVAKMDPAGLTLRYFANQPSPNGNRGNNNGRPRWRAAMSDHYYCSDGMRGEALFDSDQRAQDEGWGDTPGLAVEDLARNIIARQRKIANYHSKALREAESEANGMETKLGLMVSHP